MKILVLVESPAKVKKISGILNSQKDGNQYIVAATVGHILDLNKDKTLGVDLGNNYKPDYVEHPQKKDIIANLKRLRKQCAAVWIASDLDQEGEFIGYSICHILKLPVVSTPRIIFNEITKPAIIKAVQNPKTLDFDLLDAQKCRRITDRLIGFLITRAAKSINEKLTVGRVQTIMVKLVIDREEEMKNFEKSLSVHTTGQFNSKHGLIDAKLNKTFNNMQLAREFMELCRKSEFAIESITERVTKKSPPPPLITSTLQSLVSRSLGITPKAVLDIAQKLYQQGVISYPRTDCPRLPEEKMTECESFIREKYGNEYFESRVFKTKDASAQEAHACIYPTRIEMDCLMDDEDVEWSNWEKKVYHYVWLYTVSSQMSPSQTKNTKAKISISKCKEAFMADHNQLIFEGYLKAWGKIAVAEEGDEPSEGDEEAETEEKNVALLKLKDGESVDAKHVQAQQKAASGPSPYTESALLSQMKKIGVGRPSTYGQILQDVQSDKKQFIYKGNKSGEKLKISVLDWKPGLDAQVIEHTKEVTQNAYRNRLYSTDQGRAINSFVNEYFPNIFNYHFTGDLERKMGEIEQGNQRWYSVVDELYQEFAPKLKQFPYYRTKEDGPNPARKPKREIGTFRNEPVFAYLAKYGPVIQIGEDDRKPKPKYVKLPKEYNVETVTFEDIEPLLGLPYRLGELSDGRPAVLKKSPHGLYIDTEGSMGRGGKSRDRKRTYHVTEEMFKDFDDTVAMEKQISKIELSLVDSSIEDTEKPKSVLRTIGDINILDGKYGPYFIFNNTLVGIPKFHNVELLTYDECLEFYQSKLRKGIRGSKRSYKKKGTNSEAEPEPGSKPKVKLVMKKKLSI